MEKYKPSYMGKVITPDDKTKMTDMMTNKYDSFTAVYDAVKDSSDAISDIVVVDTNTGSVNELTVKVVKSGDLKVDTVSNPNVVQNNDVITADVKK